MAMEKDKWLDISVEAEREYIYDQQMSVKIKEPKFVSVSSLGGHAHRIETYDGNAYYISPGWRAIRWTVKGDNPLFKF